MSNLNVHVKSVKKTTKETIIQSDDGRLYLLSQIDGDDKFDKSTQANKDSFVLSDGTIVHNMYSLDNIWYHNQAARRHKYPYETNYDYQHIYKMPAKYDDGATISSIAKAADTIYMLDRPNTAGHSFVNDEMYKWLLNDNGFAVPYTKSIATELYYAGTLSDNQDIASSENSAYYFGEDQLSSTGIFAVSALLGVQYNTIYEMPGGMKQDYSKNEIVANTFKAKNQLDSKWSMNPYSVRVDYADVNVGLDYARIYDGVYNCGSLVWLKYKDNARYVKNDDSETYISAFPEYFRPMQVEISSNSDNEYSYPPQVEVLTAVNRGINASAHKSTLYSIQLTVTALDKLNVDYAETEEVLTDDGEKTAVVGFNTIKQEKVKNMIKAEIKNCIRKIAEQIAPANCQLFSVTVK